MSFKIVKIFASCVIAALACAALPQVAPSTPPAVDDVTCSAVASGLLSGQNGGERIWQFYTSECILKLQRRRDRWLVL